MREQCSGAEWYTENESVINQNTFVIEFSPLVVESTANEYWIHSPLESIGRILL